MAQVKDTLASLSVEVDDDDDKYSERGGEEEMVEVEQTNSMILPSRRPKGCGFVFFTYGCASQLKGSKHTRPRIGQIIICWRRGGQ